MFVLVGRRVWIVLALLCVVLASACAKNATQVTKPVTTDLRAYKTCVLRLETKDLGVDGDAFLAYLEGQLRDDGGLEPLDAFRESEADLVLDMNAEVESEKPNEARVKVGIVVTEKRTKDLLGEIQVRGTGTPDAPASPADTALRETGGSPRRMALHHAADEIVDYLRARRGEGKRARGEVAPERHAPMQPAPPPDDPTDRDLQPPRPVTCATQCIPTASALTDADVAKISARADPTMQILRQCLDRIGGRKIEPALILRFDSGGQLGLMRVDLGGYEDLVCVDAARAHPPRVFVHREAMVRCVLHCS
jgi:hypothetical protein